MKPIKTSSNVEFDVIYADGSRMRVKDGILVERCGNSVVYHLGTSSARTLFAATGGLLEAIAEADLCKLFISSILSPPSVIHRYFDAMKTEGIDMTTMPERQSIFRLGQMDMQASVCDMLRAMAEKTDGKTRCSLILAADLVESMEVPIANT